jgi:CRISPR-associated protein Csc1
MGERIALNAAGVRVYAGRLYNHDFLWFSSFEISKTAATLPLLHNYALSYALSGYSYGVFEGHAPRYAEDLSAMCAYATPARADGGVAWTRFTQNAINSVTLRTDDAPRGFNSPALGWRLVLDPVWAGEGSGFAFYLFARDGFVPPGVVRLGKKGCPVRIEWAEIVSPTAVFTEGAVRPTHAVNPLDVQGELNSFEPVAIPPHLILRVAEIQMDWFVFSGEHRIHLPRRFTPAGPSASWPSLTREREASPKGAGRKRARG